MLKTNVSGVNVGDIIIAKYHTFNSDYSPNGDNDNKPKYGLFFVYSVDNFWLTQLKCFSALKICTAPLSFQVAIQKSKYPFLKHDSYINCSCQQRFRLDQVIEVKGVADLNVLQCVKKQLENYNRDVDKQLENAISRYTMVNKTTSKRKGK